MKFWWRLTRTNAAHAFWFAGWFHSPEMKARTEKLMRRLEFQHTVLTNYKLKL